MLRPNQFVQLALVFCALATPAGAQSGDSLRADSAFRRRDWQATSELYARIADRLPAQGMAWLRLGMARQALDQVEPAIAAFDKALALQFQTSTAIYRLARLHARKGDATRAFGYLDQLVP